MFFDAISYRDGVGSEDGIRHFGEREVSGGLAAPWRDLNTKTQTHDSWRAWEEVSGKPIS